MSHLRAAESSFSDRGSRIQLIVIFLFISLLLFSSLESRAGERVNLKYNPINKDTILVTQGLLYNADVVLKDKHILYINDIIFANETGFAFEAGKGSVLPSQTRDHPFVVSAKLEKPSLIIHSFLNRKKDDDMLIDAIGVEWVFLKPNLSFRVGQYRFETRKAGATLQFTKDGILLTGFDIRDAK